MQYAKVVSGVLEQFPYTYANLKADNPNTSFPKQPAGVDLDLWNVKPVTQLADPPYDPATQRLVQGTPVFNDPNWEVTQVVQALTQEEMDELQKESDRQADIALFKSDPQVQALLSARVEAIDTYIENNVNNLEEAKDILKVVSKACALLAQSIVN